MRYYQGDEIKFSIGINQVTNTDGINWSRFPSVVIYLYTHQSYIVKFKNGEMTGYKPITLNEDQTIYSGKLTPDQTRNMLGEIKMSIRIKDEDGSISTTNVNTGIRIVDTPIKYE
jgi:hypothetical protein